MLNEGMCEALSFNACAEPVVVSRSAGAWQHRWRARLRAHVRALDASGTELAEGVRVLGSKING
jgi:hypothetical protein